MLALGVNNFPLTLMSLLGSQGSILLFIGVIFALIFYAFIVSFIQNWFVVALLISIATYIEQISLGEVFKRSFRKVIPYLWINFLFGAVVLGGLFLLIIPGIIFFVWFFLSSIVMVTGGGGGVTGLLKSREYVRGYFWPVVIRIIVLAGIVIIFQFIISFVYFLLDGLEIPIISIGVSFLLIIFSYLAAPLGLIYTFVMFDNLRSLKGDFPFFPSIKTKMVYITVMLIPFIVILFLLFLSVSFFASRLGQSFNNAPLDNKTPIELQNKQTETYTHPTGAWSIEHDPIYIPQATIYLDGKTENKGIGFSANLFDNYCMRSYSVDWKDNPEGLQFQDWIIREYNEQQRYYEEPVKLEDIILNGISGKKITIISSSKKSDGQTRRTIANKYYLPSKMRVYVLFYDRTLDMDVFSEEECNAQERGIQDTFNTFQFYPEFETFTLPPPTLTPPPTPTPAVQ